MSRGSLRRFTERAVYGFLGWFESFDSVWQTTLVCLAGFGAAVTATIVYPRSLMVALLISMFTNLLSVYATFTQNGLAHENKLNSNKLDAALETIDRVVDEVYVTTQALVQLAQSEQSLQANAIAQSEAILAALDELRRPRRR